MFEVQDGARTLQFEGDHLGSSTSWRPGSFRWNEFELYRTQNGSYILSRTGVSLVYHTGSCRLVSKYGLNSIAVEMLHPNALPCFECEPNFLAPVVFPESYRHWALVTEEPNSVLDALYKTDEYGARYLTRVAQRLLDEASELDSDIDQAYRIQIIP